MGGQTVVEKIAAAHRVVSAGDHSPRAGDFVRLRPRHVLTHDNTAAVLRKFRALGATRVHDPRQPVFALDHDVQNRDPRHLAQYAAIEDFAREQGIAFHAAGEGIGHQLLVEGGFVMPGALVVASDSHANTYGAMGAVGTPVVRTDAAVIWATGELWWQIPRTVSVVFEGELPPTASGKDVILTLCGLHNQDEVLGAAVEFSGPGVASLDMEARLTIANMTTEWGAISAWFPPDLVTAGYLRNRARAPGTAGGDRLVERDVAALVETAPRPDPDAARALRITLDLSRVVPCVAGPDTVQRVTTVRQLERRGVPVHRAYLVSCANARPGDLAAAARVLRGKHVAPGVELYLAAASRESQERAEARGDWATLLAAGATALPPGCGPCIGLGAGLLEPGEVGISATNRNFKGRMGSRDASCYLASPAVVAASAVAGHITSPHPGEGELPPRHVEIPAATAHEPSPVAILPGFPRRLEGRLVFLPRDHLDTDGIFPGTHLYRDGLCPDELAALAMANYDPHFGDCVAAGDVLVAGRNFGAGSSREQAVTCLQAKGLALVIAASLSRTFTRNAFNHGFPVLECPGLVTHLRAELRAEIRAGTKTIVRDEALVVDFAAGTVHRGGHAFPFAPLGEVPQALVVAGGIENLVRPRLADDC